MCLLYYKHPALVKPSPKAFKPSRPLQVLCGLSPSGDFYLYAPPVCNGIYLSREKWATDRETAVQLTGILAALFIYGLVSPLPPFSIQKGGQS